MHDTVELEKRGIPATVFLTEIFRGTAVHTFRTKGMDGHPFIVLPHPISNLTPEQMRMATLRHIDEFVSHLTD